MAKKKINQLDASSVTLDRIFAHANPSTGKADRAPVSELIALLTAQTPVKTYADETALLANTDLAIGYIGFVADDSTFYLYNGPTPNDIDNYTEFGGGAVDSVNGEVGVVVINATDIPNTPAGNIAATTVQAAINELDTEKQALINAAVAITDAASMDLIAIKHTLTTSSATRTFTISYTGDDISIKVILNATSSVFTFPAGALCVSEGIASGNNTCPLAGASGDVYAFAIKHWGSAVYTVVAKNTGQ